MDKYLNEQVFVIPSYKISYIEHGFTHQKNNKNIWNLFDNLGKFVSRNYVEGKNSLQQLIPYVLIRNDNEEYLVAKRTNLSGEERLHNLISIGFGGHLNIEDSNINVLLNGTLRELNEELNITINNEKDIKFVGYVRDLIGTTSDHTGVVFLIDNVNKNNTSIKETEYLEGHWMNKAQLIDNYSKLESWAKFIVDYMVDSIL